METESAGPGATGENLPESDAELTKSVDNQLLLTKLLPTEAAAKRALQSEIQAGVSARQAAPRLPKASMQDLRSGAALLGHLRKPRS